MTFGNYYNMNIMNNGWSGILQQGMSMFGGGSSYGMMSMNGSLFGGANMFSNCFGEPNYDAMAGYTVANVLVGVAGQAISTLKAENQNAKQEIQNSKERYEEIDSEISDLKNTKPEDKIEAKYDTAIETAEAKQTTLTGDIVTLQKQIQDAKALATPDQKAIDDLEKALKTKQEELNKLNGDASQEGSIANLKQAKADRLAEIQKEIDEKIKNLEAEKADLEEIINDDTLDRADGSQLKRTSAKKFNAKWDANGNANQGVEFTKGDMRYAIAGFRSASDDNEKKNWANKIAAIYDYFQQNDVEKITPDFKAARKIVNPYVG